jgi:preprotein translocase subunit YajC
MEESARDFVIGDKVKVVGLKGVVFDVFEDRVWVRLGTAKVEVNVSKEDVKLQKPL